MFLINFYKKFDLNWLCVFQESSWVFGVSLVMAYSFGLQFYGFFKEAVILSLYFYVNHDAAFERRLTLVFSFIGTIGFFACFWFVTKIYSVVKVD